MENNQADNLKYPDSTDSGIKTTFPAEVTQLVKDLFYPSESDEPIEWFSIKAKVKNAFTVSDLEFFMGYPPSVKAEEISVENFWEPVTTIEDWYGEEEHAQVDVFLSLKQLLETNLKNMQAFRAGQIEIDLYLLGPLNEEEWGGLKTKIIET